MTPKEIQTQLAALGIRPARIRGQHFLIDQAVLKTIVDAAELSKKDAVLEIGPGLGVLTRELLHEAGRVVAVELDLALAGHLKKVFGPQGLRLIPGDALAIDTAIIHAMCGNASYKLVANIPYNITSAVLEKFLAISQPPTMLVLLAQREVAERVCARSPYLSRLGVLVQYFGKPEIIRIVRPGSFWPAPRVESAVLRIRIHAREMMMKREQKIPRKKFFQIVEAGFFSPRKKLLGNLFRAFNMPADELEIIFDHASILRDVRPATLTVEQWLALAVGIKE